MLRLDRLARTPPRVATLAAAFALAASVGCGAPSQSAKDVAGMFNGFDAFADRMAEICATLQGRHDAPNLDALGVDVDQCRSAGVDAQNLTGLHDLKLGDYHGALADDGGGKNQVLTARLRTELWLNQSLLDLASRILGDTGAGLPSLAEGADVTPKLKGVLPGDGLVDLKITVTKAPVIDRTTLAFALSVHVSAKGAVTIDNDIDVNGTLIDDAVAVTVASVGAQDFAQSLLKRFKVLAIVTPYADDTYFGATMDLELYSLGFGGLVEAKVKELVAQSVDIGRSFLAVP